MRLDGPDLYPEHWHFHSEAPDGRTLHSRPMTQAEAQRAYWLMMGERSYHHVKRGELSAWLAPCPSIDHRCGLQIELPARG